MPKNTKLCIKKNNELYEFYYCTYINSAKDAGPSLLDNDY